MKRKPGERPTLKELREEKKRLDAARENLFRPEEVDKTQRFRSEEYRRFRKQQQEEESESKKTIYLALNRLEEQEQLNLTEIRPGEPIVVKVRAVSAEGTRPNSTSQEIQETTEPEVYVFRVWEERGGQTKVVNGRFEFPDPRGLLERLDEMAGKEPAAENFGVQLQIIPATLETKEINDQEFEMVSATVGDGIQIGLAGFERQALEVAEQGEVWDFGMLRVGRRVSIPQSEGKVAPRVVQIEEIYTTASENSPRG